MTKTVLLGLVALAFVTGSVLTGTAYAKENPNGQPFQALWDAIANLQDQIDNISDGDSDPTNELQLLSTRAISGGFSGVDPGELKVFTLECSTGEVLTGVDSFFRGTAEAGSSIPKLDSNGNVIGITLQVFNPSSGEPNGQGVMRIICSSLVTAP